MMKAHAKVMNLHRFNYQTAIVAKTVLFFAVNVPYQDEPLAKSSDGSSDKHEQNTVTDLDGLTPNTLVARKDGIISVSSW